MEALEKQVETNGLPVLDWPNFDSAADADAIRKLEAKKRGAPRLATRSMHTVPPSLLGNLMGIEVSNLAEMCLQVIWYSRDFNTRAGGAQQTELEDDETRENETREDVESEMVEDKNSDMVPVGPILAQEVLLPVLQWLWAVQKGLVLWGEATARRCLINGGTAAVGTLPPGASPPSDSALAAVMTAVVELTSAMQNGRSNASTTLATEKEDKDDAACNKMVTMDLKLLLWASELTTT